MALTWDRSLETGIAAIDLQHQELYRAINELLQAMLDSRGAEEVVRLMDFLKSYVVKHFGMEEELMRLHRYPDAAAHVAEHQRFVKDFQALEAELAKSGPSTLLAIQVNRRVCTWLREHIAVVDSRLGAFLRTAQRPGVGRSGT